MSFGTFEDRLHPRDLHGRFRAAFPHPPKPPILGHPIGEETSLSRGVEAARIKAPLMRATSPTPPPRPKHSVVPLAHGLNTPPEAPSLTGEISSSDIQSMAAYKGPYYYNINHELRTDTTPDDDLEVKGMDQVMESHVTHTRATVVRVMGTGFADTLKEGDTFTDNGFVSTTRDEAGIRAYNSSVDVSRRATVAKIQIPEGTHAFDFGPADKEREIVLDRGMSFTVIGEQRTPDGQRVLIMRASGTSHNS